MAKYSKEKMKCKTCGCYRKAIIKEWVTSKWYKCINCKEMIGEMNDPIKGKKYITGVVDNVSKS